MTSAAAADDWSEKSRELKELLARSGLGDRAAFAELYRRTSAHLFGVVLRINRDRAQAEDVLQEAYVNVWRAAAGFDAAKAQPLTWLTSIARNRAIDSLRRQQAQPRLQTQSGDLDQDSESSDVYEQIADESAGPLDLLARAADARARCLHGTALGAAAPEHGARLLRRPEPFGSRGAIAPAARHGEELGAARADGAQGVPRARRRARWPRSRLG